MSQEEPLNTAGCDSKTQTKPNKKAHTLKFGEVKWLTKHKVQGAREWQ